jgi:AcrR family transcriptional regulator
MEQPAETRSVGTRERILEVALGLFSEQGYEKTSLREVAERVGVTKAALYYHFPSKEDILTELVEAAHGVGHHFLAGLLPEDGPLDLDELMRKLEEILDVVLGQRKVFIMMERNRAALEALEHDDLAHTEDHRIQQEERWDRFMSDPAVPLGTRVRVAASVGAVMAGAWGTSRGGLIEIPLEELKRELVAAVRDLLGAVDADQ